MPTLNNYTVSDAVFSVVEGSTIYGTQQTATLTIIPNTGFTVDYQDFSIVAGTLPSEVDSVVFQQDGDNVLCIVTFNSTVVMPSENLILNLCVEGSATEKKFFVQGQFNVKLENYNVDVVDDQIEKSYSANGLYGETKKIIEWTITTPNALYEIIPNTDVISLPNSNYTYTITPTYDINGNYDSSLVEVFYTFPDYNFDAGADKVTLYTGGIEIFVEEPVLTAYTISNTNVSQNGMFVNMVLYGNPGAEISVEIDNGTTTEMLLTNYIFDGYSYALQIEIPAVLVDTFYTITISGDLSSTFDTATGQASVFTINQYTYTTISIDTETTGTLLASETYDRTYSSYSIPLQGSTASQIAVDIDVTESGGNDLNIINEISRESFSNAAIYYKTVSGNFSSATTITLNSTDGLEAGMLVKNINESFAYVEILNVVNSTDIELDTAVSYFDGAELEISNNLNSIITPYLQMTLSGDSKTVNISGYIEIEQYGKGDITFSLNLDSIISIAPAVGGLFSGLISAVGMTSSACTLDITEPIYIMGNYDAFYIDAAGTIPFNGQDLYWSFQTLIDVSKNSAIINSSGTVSGPIELCF